MSSFCICKSYSHFFSKNTCELDIVLTRTVDILTTNKLVKLTMLWTTRPCTFQLRKAPYLELWFIHVILISCVKLLESTRKEIWRLIIYIPLLYISNSKLFYNFRLWENLSLNQLLSLKEFYCPCVRWVFGLTAFFKGILLPMYKVSIWTDWFL